MFSITCPVCGLGKIEVELTGGCPGTYWDPPEPPDLEIVKEECECGESSLVDEAKYYDEVERLAFEAAGEWERDAAEAEGDRRYHEMKDEGLI